MESLGGLLPRTEMIREFHAADVESLRRLLSTVPEATQWCADDFLLASRKIFLEVRESNEAARSFYARMGFTEAGRRRDYYREPAEDAFVLVRTVE